MGLQYAGYEGFRPDFNPLTQEAGVLDRHVLTTEIITDITNPINPPRHPQPGSLRQDFAVPAGEGWHDSAEG